MRHGADGRYRFAELAAGRYRVCADSEAGIGPTIRSPCTCRAAGAPRRRSTRPTSRPRSRLGGRRGDDPPPGSRANPRPRHRPRGRSGNRRLCPGLLEGVRSMGLRVRGRSFDEDGGYELRVDGGRVYHVCFHPWDGDQVALQCWNDAPSLPSSTGIRGGRPNRTIDGIDAQLDPAARIEGLISGYPTGTQGTISIRPFARTAASGGRRDGIWWSRGRARRHSRSPASRPVRIGCASPPRTSSSSPCSPTSASAAPRRRRPGPRSRSSPAR